MKINLIEVLKIVTFSLGLALVLGIAIHERITFGAANGFIVILATLGVLVAPVMYSAYRSECKKRGRCK